MSPFTDAQQAVLLAIGNCLTLIARRDALDREQRVSVQVEAVQRLLIDMGLVTTEEMESAAREVQAGRAVDAALNPELRAAEEELNALLRGIREGQELPTTESES